MKLFKCQNCGQLLYFEWRCERCLHRLGYLADSATLSALAPEGDDWQMLGSTGERYRFCANAEFDICNWLMPASSPDAYCIACRHNRTIPDIGQSEYLAAWRKIELAKHRLFYSLLRLRLPFATRREDPGHGLAFDFLAAPPSPHGAKVMTGHDNGLITLAVEEADDATREQLRQKMGEPYRTLLGHFRHESGHYFWDRLVGDGNQVEAFRALFGDERTDYGQALAAHYARGTASNWQGDYVSSYASSHPWEDFAETWAHYLHIVDTLEMAGAFGLRIEPGIDENPAFRAKLDFDPHEARDIEQLVEAWLPLAFAVNSLNRSMGQPDLYPFILPPAVIEKLRFIHRLVHRQF